MRTSRLLHLSVWSILAATCAAGVLDEEGAAVRPRQIELSTTTGGACSVCISQDYCNTVPIECERIEVNGAPIDKWRRKVGSGVVQKFCSSIQLSIPRSGRERCEAIAEQDCVYTYHCTRSGCPEESCYKLNGAERKPTDCRMGGHNCIIPAS